MTEKTCPNDKVRRVLHEEIPIPRVNELPFEEGQKWAKKSYAQARFRVDEKRAQEIKERFPIRTADYVEKQTFGPWRILGPSSGQDKSPLEMVLEHLKPVIKPDQWREFKKQLRKLLIQVFDLIGCYNYETTGIKKENDRINQLINEFIRPGVSARLDFVPHPETAEFFDYSPRLLAIRNKIWVFFTGQPLDLSMFKQPPGPDSPRQMDMHLDLQVTMKE